MKRGSYFCVGQRRLRGFCRKLLRSRRAFSALVAGLIAIGTFGTVRANGASCESLMGLKLPETTITMAQMVPVGGLSLPSRAVPKAQRAHIEQSLQKLPAFCRITATLKPTEDSDIKIEVWMPEAGWNGRFLGVGNGGWAGTINYGGLAQGLQQHFATASTDTGHTGNGSDARFALGHPEKLIDFAYRSVHEMTVQAKMIVAGFYGEGSRLSYWNGCSTGGYQGLSEAQRFPDDYIGIVEGDPANYFTHLMFGVIWPPMVTHKDAASYIPPAKYALIHKAVLKACDALDGITDGILNDPRRCHFDPKVLECKGPNGPGCLTAAQVEALRKIYAGPRNPRTGEQIFPGLEPGSELPWSRIAPVGIPASYFKYVLFKNPNWNWRDLNFDSDVTLADRLTGSVLNAINPDLEAFKAHGGKLIMYHGWSDQVIAPLESVDYYKNVVVKMGGLSATESFARLFMVPGMLHCGRGPGPDNWDKAGVLEQWVEHGVVPDKIVASHQTNGVVNMTRPLCPYPEIARWKGTGSTNDAANFVCVNEKNLKAVGIPQGF